MNPNQKYLNKLIKRIQECIAHIKLLATQTDNAIAIHNSLKKLVNSEAQLRESCGIGARFNVLRTQLSVILQEVIQSLDHMEQSKQLEDNLKTDETSSTNQNVIFVYLFNVNGNVLRTWRTLLQPSALMEHSVNRPIYAKQDEINKFLRNKDKPERHAFLEIAVDKKDILPFILPLTDSIGQQLLRIQEGALKIENIKSFIHMGKQYKVSLQGELIGDF